MVSPIRVLLLPLMVDPGVVPEVVEQPFIKLVRKRLWCCEQMHLTTSGDGQRFKKKQKQCNPNPQRATHICRFQSQYRNKMLGQGKA